jgi:hypothetical protein
MLRSIHTLAGMCAQCYVNHTLSSSFDHQGEIDLLKHQKIIVWSVSPYLRRKLGPVLTVI